MMGIRKHSLTCALLTFAWFGIAKDECRADVQVVWERAENSQAKPAFKFEKIPAPSQNDAATNAGFRIVLGQADPNGADVAALHDGRLPTGVDQPENNFFFDAGSTGGRLVIDLEAAREIRRINTYSWHRSSRAPQVYQLYAHDGTGEKFVATPGKETDLAAAGWKRIAAVDTRPAEGRPGGQYGVTIFDATGALGTFRYLLFDVARTTDADQFSNTFFSEIDVDDGREYAQRSVPAPDPAQANGYEFVFDTTQTPRLQPWVDRTLRPICEQWYPRIVAQLGSEGFTAPRRISITFFKDMEGVANTSRTQIRCAGPWFERNLQGEAAGAVVHELVHVVQQYGRTQRDAERPGWLVEGIADYIRWFQYEPPAQRPRPDPARASYRDSYRTTGAFLHYVTETHGKEVVPKLNAALRKGVYRSNLWQEVTGKSVDELWADYVKTLVIVPKPR